MKPKLHKRQDKLYCSCHKSWVNLTKLSGTFIRGQCGYCKSSINHLNVNKLNH